MEHACGVRDAWRREKVFCSVAKLLSSCRNFPSSLRTVRRVAADAREHEQGKQKRQHLPVSGQRTKKTMLPKRGTSSFVVVFLTRGKWVKLPRGEHVTFVCSGFVAPNGVDEFLRHTAAIETIHRVFLEREWYFNGAAIEQAFLHFHFDRGEAGFDILQFHD